MYLTTGGVNEGLKKILDGPANLIASMFLVDPLNPWINVFRIKQVDQLVCFEPHSPFINSLVLT
jgi:hypothetical protein